MLKTAQLQIEGMTCLNCQEKIERELAFSSGIEKVAVSYNEGSASLSFDDGLISLDQVVTLIEDLGYRVRRGRFTLIPDIMRTIISLAAILLLFALLQQLGVLNLLVPSQLADTTMGYGMLFVIGLLTSVHCLAMCGGINLSQSIAKVSGKSTEISESAGKNRGKRQKPVNGDSAGSNNRFSAFAPAALYNLGRVVSYTVIGFILGGIGMLLGGGAEIGIPSFFQGILKLFAGTLMVVMGLNMLGLLPWLRRLQPRMPKAFAGIAARRSGAKASPLLVGLLNGLMPCGPLQSMQLVALVSGSPFAGAFSMFLFSLGTVPLVLGFGSIVSALGRKFTQTVTAIGSMLVVVLGLAMLSQGGALSGLFSFELLLAAAVVFAVSVVISRFRFGSSLYKMAIIASFVVVSVASLGVWNHQILLPNAQAGDVGGGILPEGGGQAADGQQVVNSTLLPGGYPTITVQVGVPVKWVIDAPQGSINGCNNRMLIQEYGLEHSFKLGKNEIEFTPTRVGKIQYSCWMGMIHGTIIVKEGEITEA